MDIGQPKVWRDDNGDHNQDFISGTKLYLNHLKVKKPAGLASGDGIRGNVLISPKAKIGANCRIGPDVVIGDDAIIGDGVCLSNCTIMNGVQVKNYAYVMWPYDVMCSYVDTAIIGFKSTVGMWTRIEPHCDKEVTPSVIADDVQIADTICLCGVFVLPHKGVSQSFRSHTILM